MRIRRDYTGLKSALASAFAIGVFVFALTVSSFHNHDDATTRDDCPICRFQQTTTTSPVEHVSPPSLRQTPPLPLVTVQQDFPRDLFRFYPIYPHAPPSNSAS